MQPFDDRLQAGIDEHSDVLLKASHDIHDNPELGFDEHRAHELLTGILERAGFEVTRGAYDLSTAFMATAGGSGPVIAVMCEYDALPEIGHGCGHNIVAAAGLGAALVLQPLLNDVGGSVRVLGTPAEEGGGGKILMAERGALSGVDAAMMVHPADRHLRRMSVVAIERMRVEYKGKAAHAAAAPHLGRNALDAAVLGYVNVAALRQHIGSADRIHGVFTQAGTKPNIVPETAVAEWYVRSPSLERLSELSHRVRHCLSAGASASGCTMAESAIGPTYPDMISSRTMMDLYATSAGRLGEEPAEPVAGDEVVGSTDMGHVSYMVPSIHPMVKAAPRGVSLHTPQFADYARSPSGDEAVLFGAKAMAATALGLLADPAVLRAARAELEAQLGKLE